MKKSSFQIVSIFILLGLLLSACQFNITRNSNGSLDLETTVSAATIQSEITAAIADPLVKELKVNLESGYILVSGTRKRLNSDQTDTLAFRLDLGVSNGHLAATISNAQLDGTPIEQNRIALWNQEISTRLERAGQKRSNTTLQSVTVTNAAVSMVWQIQK